MVQTRTEGLDTCYYPNVDILELMELPKFLF